MLRYSLIPTCLVTASLFLSAQDSLGYLQRIDSIFAARTTTELLELQESSRLNWLRYLPTLGMTYTLEGQPRPVISFNTTLLYTAAKEHRQNALKRQAIRERFTLHAQQTKAKLSLLLTQYHQALLDIQHRRELLAIDTELFRIQEQQYLNLEISPADFLQAKRSLLTQQQALEKREADAQILLLRCQQAALIE